MKIVVTFDEKWFFAEGGKNAFAANRLASLCRKEFQEKLSKVSSSLNTCELELDTDKSPEAVRELLTNLISAKLLGEGTSPSVFRLELDGQAAPQRTASQPAQGASPAGAPEEEAVQAPSVLDRVRELVGADDFKALCGGLHLRAAMARKNHTEDVLLSETYLFSGHTGYGCGKAMGLLADLFREEGLLTDPASPVAVSLPSRTSQEFAQQMAQLTEKLPNILSKPRLVVIDLDGWTENTHLAEFKQILMTIFQRNKGSVVIFRMPYAGRETLRRVKEDIDDILYTNPVVFPLFTGEQLHELAARGLQKYGMTMAEDAWSVFDRKIGLESQDGRFYGAHTVKKVVNEIIRTAEMHSAQTGQMPEALTAEMLSALAPDRKEEAPMGLAELEKMVGMEAVARKVREVVNSITFARNNGTALPGMHMCFTGNPGTGKTTAARVIGTALKEAGILSVGKFREHRGRDLCGQYVGHTAPLTTSICREAYGSVLFIDEAYTLAYGSQGIRSNDYGQEAIDTLIAEMENHRDEMIVIVAGYPEEMQTFLNANPGMRDRIPYTIHFPNYTREQLYEIFLRMSEENFRFGEGFREEASSYFMALTDETLENRTFGNARFVRNLYERVWSKASMRCPGVTAAELTLEVEDFQAAAGEMPEFADEKKVRPIGFR